MDTPVTRRQRATYSLQVGRNFGILTVIAANLLAQALNATLVGTKREFRLAYGISFAVLSAIMQTITLVYAFQSESRNRHDSFGVRPLAVAVSLLLYVAVALFLGFIYGLELQ